MRILLLATDLFSSSSGIAQVGRLVCKALCDSPSVEKLQVLSLIDNLGQMPDAKYLNGGKAGYKSFGGNKSLFSKEVLLPKNSKYDIALTLHVSLSPLILLLSQFSRSIRTVSFAHGVEVWRKMSWLRREGAKRLDAIFSVSNFTRELLSQANEIDPGKIRVLHNCLDPYWSPLKVLTNDLENVRHPNLLTVSRLSKYDSYKGHAYVIKALAKINGHFPGLQYNIVGKGELLFELQQLSEHLGLNTVVNFLGFVDDSKLNKYYSDCDIFIMPSKKEGFGLVFAEAMAYGKPVIAGNVDATPEVVMHGETGILVDPDNIDGVADAIVTLLSEQHLRERLGIKGRQLVYDKFSFPQYSQKLLQYLTDITVPNSRSENYN